MKILIINPNSTDAITKRIDNEAQHMADAETEIETITSVHGPSAIETAADELIAAYYVLEELKARVGSYDAAVIACASDPGLFAARDVIPVPVTGIFEAGIYACNMHGGRFSVIGSCDWLDIPCFIENAAKYGLRDHLASVSYTGTGVCGVDDSCLPLLGEKILEAKNIYGAGAIMLGCAAFAGMGRQLSKQYNTYVTDGICEAVGMAKMFAEVQQARR